MDRGACAMNGRSENADDVSTPNMSGESGLYENPWAGSDDAGSMFE